MLRADRFSVRIMPYRNMDKVIEGVVMTFFDVGVAKRLEAQLRAAVAGQVGNVRGPGASR